MCVGLPGKVVAVEPAGALVDMGGQTRRVGTLLLPDIAVGEDVLVTCGLIIARLPPEEAEMRRELFTQLLRAVDQAAPSSPHVREDLAE